MKLSETIKHWTVDPDFDQNETDMMSKFHGYDREMRHYTKKEKREINDPSHVTKMTNAFARSPVPFSIYFWQSNDPDYDKTAFQGMVDEKWLKSRLGEKSAELILSQTSSDAVTVVITNNLSDENKIGLGSSWALAHRIVHAMVGDSDTTEARDIRFMFKQFLIKIITHGYGLEWPDTNSPHGRIFARDYQEIYGQLMGCTLGTMKSARDKTITSVYEWWYETVTQYIITGKIKFNPLPDMFDEFELTRDPAKRKIVLKAWAMLPDRLEKMILKLMDEGRGHIFVV